MIFVIVNDVKNNLYIYYHFTIFYKKKQLLIVRISDELTVQVSHKISSFEKRGCLAVTDFSIVITLVVFQDDYECTLITMI